MKTYRLLGHPLGLDFVEIQSRGVGEEWEADMDPGIERLLIDSGAIAILGESKPESKPKAKATKAEPEEEKESKDAGQQTAGDRKGSAPRRAGRHSGSG